MAEIFTTDLGTMVTWVEDGLFMSCLFPGHAQRTVISAIVFYVKRMEGVPTRRLEPISRL